MLTSCFFFRSFKCLRRKTMTSFGFQSFSRDIFGPWQRSWWVFHVCLLSFEIRNDAITHADKQSLIDIDEPFKTLIILTESNSRHPDSLSNNQNLTMTVLSSTYPKTTNEPIWEWKFSIIVNVVRIYRSRNHRSRTRETERERRKKRQLSIWWQHLMLECTYAHPLSRLMMMMIMDGDGGSQMDFSLCLYSTEMNTTLARREEKTTDDNDHWICIRANCYDYVRRNDWT